MAEIFKKTSYGHSIEFQMVNIDDITKEVEVVDLSSFTDVDFIIERPDGTTVELTGGFITDGTDGWIKATVTAGDGVFTQIGHYKVEPILSNATSYFPAEIITIYVGQPLKEAS